MKVSGATGENDKIIYFDIRTDRGTRIGSCIPNLNPLGDDSEITLTDCERYATMWAAATDLLEALEVCILHVDSHFYPEEKLRAEEAIKKARGL